MAVRDEKIAHLRSHFVHFDRGLQRAESLLDLYRTISQVPSEDDEVFLTDLLRAGVVMAHANFEEYLRSITLLFCLEAKPDFLNKISLIDANSKEPKKFQVHDLIKHKDMEVSDLIRSRVERYLERSNYNNVVEVSALLEQLGFELEGLREHFSPLEEFLSRRHKIVHRGDRVRTALGEPIREEELELKQVEVWLDHLQNLAGKLIAQSGVKLGLADS